MASILAVVIVSVVPWQLVHDDNGGGGYPYLPIEPPQAPQPVIVVYPDEYTPILQPIALHPFIVGSIDLTWSSVLSAIGYQIYVSKDYAVWELTSSTTLIILTIQDLTSGDYRFKVRGYNIAGYTEFSNVELITISEEEEEEEEPDPLPPDEPILYTIESPNTDREISLEWNVVPNTLYYEVYKSIDGGDYNIIYPIIEENYYNDLVFVDGTYSYKIKAKNDIGTSGFSNVESVVVCISIFEPPNDPVLESIVPEVSNDGVVSLSWSSVPNALYYEVYKSYNESSFVLLKTLDENYCDDLVLEDGVYSYKVKAWNDIGSSGFSNMEYVVVYISEPIEPIEPTDDNTMLYILLGVLAILIVPVVILVKRKSKKP